MEKKFTRDMGTKKWLENAWYYYRWHTFIGLALIALITMFIYDMATQEKMDANMMLAAKYPANEEQAAYLESLFEAQGTDLDGDGVVNYFVNPVIFPMDDSGMGAQTLMAMQTRFVGELSTGASQILILDAYTLAQMDDPELFTDLSQYGFSTTPDGWKVPLRDFVECAGTPLEPVADLLFVTLRSSETAALKKMKEEGVTLYQDQLALLQRVAAEN